VNEIKCAVQSCAKNIWDKKRLTCVCHWVSRRGEWQGVDPATWLKLEDDLYLFTVDTSEGSCFAPGIKIRVNAWADDNSTICRSRCDDSARQGVKSNNDNAVLVKRFFLVLSWRHPKSKLFIPSTNINLAWSSTNCEFVSSEVPDSINICFQFFDLAKLGQVLLCFCILLPNNDSAISWAWEQQASLWVPIQSADITIVLKGIRIGRLTSLSTWKSFHLLMSGDMFVSKIRISRV
jgi:hypothetical protein